MACVAPLISASEAVLTSVAFTVLYVGVLYLPFNSGDRNARRVILSRLATISFIAACIELYVRIRVPAVSAKASVGTRVPAITVATFLTLLLYAGHFLAARQQPLARHSLLQSSTRMLALRNYLLAPLLEELVFRRQTLLLWSCQPMTRRLLLPAALFSIAHAHRARTLGLATAGLQLAYTFLFGIYSAALYVSTNTVYAPIAAHVICNVLELPDFGAIANHSRKRLIILLYSVAVVVFAIVFAPLTALVRPYQIASE